MKKVKGISKGECRVEERSEGDAKGEYGGLERVLPGGWESVERCVVKRIVEWV